MATIACILATNKLYWRKVLSFHAPRKLPMVWINTPRCLASRGSGSCICSNNQAETKRPMAAIENSSVKPNQAICCESVKVRMPPPIKNTLKDAPIVSRVRAAKKAPRRRSGTIDPIHARQWGWIRLIKPWYPTASAINIHTACSGRKAANAPIPNTNTACKAAQ